MIHVAEGGKRELCVCRVLKGGENAMEERRSRLSTGIDGLDEVLEGGLVPARSYLVRGGPGSGKTTFGFHFLTCGARLGEKVLFICLGEPEDLIKENAETLGFDLSARLTDSHNRKLGAAAGR